MKKLFTLFLISISIQSFSQEIDYFADNPEWRQTSVCAVPYPCVQTDQYVYYVNGDSTINDVVYKKIFRRGIYNQNWMSNPPAIECGASGMDDSFYLLMLQDGLQMYIRAMDTENLILLYDFDLNVGDALPMTYNNYTSDILIESIDSLLVGDEYRKRFHFQGLWASVIIEGIGSDLGLFEPMGSIFECGHSLDCFALNEITYYPSLNADCELNVSINEEVDEIELNYYPNPVIDQLNFSVSEKNKIIQVELLTGRGQKCKVVLQQHSHGNYSIDMSELSSDLYFVKLWIENGQTTTFKVLKK
jgi:hypothetical protein